MGATCGARLLANVSVQAAFQVAVRAGYSPATAQEQGAHLLSNVMVQAAQLLKKTSVLEAIAERLLKKVEIQQALAGHLRKFTPHPRGES